MSARVTNAQLLARIAALEEQLAAKAAKGAPASEGKAESGFVKFLHERAASRVACEIPSHKGKCNRKFTPASSGRTNHVARID